MRFFGGVSLELIMADVRRHDGRAWAMLDQAVVAGANFAIAAMLARWLGIDVFGQYAVALMIAQFCCGIQTALVGVPMSTHLSVASSESRAGIVGGYFLLAASVSIATLAIAIASWVIFEQRFTSGGSLAGLSHFCAFSLLYQMQDFTRKALYAESKTRDAFVADILGYGGQLVLLAGAKLVGPLELEGAFQVGVLAYFAAMLVGTWRLNPRFESKQARLVAHRVRGVGFHYVLSSQLQWLGGSGVVLLGSYFLGAASAGAIRAVQSMLGPVNVVLQLLDNLVPPRAARVHAEFGAAALNEYLGRIFSVGLVPLIALALLSAAFGSRFLAALFGPEYAAYSVVLVIQAIYYSVSYGYKLLTFDRRVRDDAESLSKAGMVWVIGAYAALPVLYPLADAAGVLLSALVGQLCAAWFVVKRGGRLRMHL